MLTMTKANKRNDPKRIRHTQRRFAAANGKRAYLDAAASGR
jgi:hypothetical protein